MSLADQVVSLTAWSRGIFSTVGFLTTPDPAPAGGSQRCGRLGEESHHSTTQFLGSLCLCVCLVGEIIELVNYW